mgnify:CR=1 FL=1
MEANSVARRASNIQKPSGHPEEIDDEDEEGEDDDEEEEEEEEEGEGGGEEEMHIGVAAKISSRWKRGEGAGDE